MATKGVSVYVKQNKMANRIAAEELIKANLSTATDLDGDVIMSGVSLVDTRDNLCAALEHTGGVALRSTMRTMLKVHLDG